MITRAERDVPLYFASGRLKSLELQTLDLAVESQEAILSLNTGVELSLR